MGFISQTPKVGLFAHSFFSLVTFRWPHLGLVVRLLIRLTVLTHAFAKFRTLPLAFKGPKLLPSPVSHPMSLILPSRICLCLSAITVFHDSHPMLYHTNSPRPFPHNLIFAWNKTRLYLHYEMTYSKQFLGTKIVSGKNWYDKTQQWYMLRGQPQTLIQVPTQLSKLAIIAHQRRPYLDTNHANRNTNGMYLKT